jgi:hypothetical protein
MGDKSSSSASARGEIQPAIIAGSKKSPIESRVPRIGSVQKEIQPAFKAGSTQVPVDKRRGKDGRLCSIPPPPPICHPRDLIGESSSDRMNAYRAEKLEQAGLPPIIDAAEFLKTPQEQPRELVAGMLHQGSKLVLGGGSKSFKTWTLLDLALSVSHGLPWLGRKTDSGRVLYVNFEIQDYAWQNRIVEVARAKGITELQTDTIHLWNLRGHASDFKDLLPEITDQTAQSDFALIILDPIYKLYGKTDENKAGDVAALLNGIEALAVQTGAAIAFGAHFSKGNQSGKEAIDRISGSGVFARDPDSILIFTRHQEEDAFAVESILRNFAPVKPFAVRWKFPLFEIAGELDPARLKKPKGRTAIHTEKSVLDVLGKKSLTTTEWKNLADKQNGTSGRTFYELMKKLVIGAKVSKSKSNKWKCVKTD